ncbi:MAG: DNA primase [Candidatus Omnitrophica bacterium]|nr:DNA primase [Candidatus Omnitrophota bacterium]
MIPERTIQEIQERLDIVEVIGAALSLKRAGRNFKGLCPFHPEKTPSFMVYPHKQFFICYGCGAGGDALTFVMRHQELEFPEAVRLLAERAGVAVPQVSGGAVSKQHPELYRAHEVAARFYHDLLVKSKEGQSARDYLTRRGVEPQMWETLCLGYAPNRWDGLLARGKEEKLSPQALEKAGLAVPREGSGGWYDRFRDRVLFPVWDARGRVIGFGGRVLDDSTPKYMNSPETELYVKGRILYGLHLASPHVREKDFCIVVEGYMDLLSPAQHGIRNVVASMGTSLTENQVQLIRKMTRHVVMVYDGDYAGEMATLRGLDLFLEAQMRVKVAALPAGFDPDSLIRKQGMEAFLKVIQESQDLFDYKLGLLRRRFDPNDLEGRVRICEEMLPTIKRVPNAIQRGEYIKRLSELLGVAETLLWSELKETKLSGSSSSWRPKGIAQPQAVKAMSAEDLLAGLIVEDPSRVAQLEGRLEPEQLKGEEVRELVSQLMNRSREKSALPRDHRELLNLFERGTGDWESRVIRWLAWADSVEEKDRALEEVIQCIQQGQRRTSLENLQASIRKAELSGDEETTAQLILQYNQLVKAPVGQAEP